MEFDPAIQAIKVGFDREEIIWRACEIEELLVHVSKIGAELLNRALFFAFFKNHATGGQELFFFYVGDLVLGADRGGVGLGNRTWKGCG